MARVLLGELVAGNIATFYSANLSAEITAIDADAGDTFKLARPTVYDYEKLEISAGETDATTGYAAHLEIFEADIAFEDPYTDHTGERAVYNADVVIRLTFFNGQAFDKATIETLRRRYSVALYNVLNKNPLLGDATSAIRLVKPTGVSYDRELLDGGMLKTRITLTAQARCEEVQP